MTERDASVYVYAFQMHQISNGEPYRALKTTTTRQILRFLVVQKS